MTLSTLMPSWRQVRLGQISTLIQYGINTKAQEDIEGTLYLRISDIDNEGRTHIRSPKYIPLNTPNLEKYILKPGDVLIARSGSVGRSYVYSGSDKPWVFASHLIRFRLKAGLVLPKYIGFFLRSPVYFRYIANITRSVARPNITSKELANLPIPLPPLSEQQRIVDILNEANKLHDLQRDMNIRIGNFIPALFQEMFGSGGPISQTRKGWKNSTIGRVTENVQYGIDEKLIDDGDIPVLRINNITNDGWMDLSDIKYLSTKKNDFPSDNIKHKDILFNRTNRQDRVGIAGIWLENSTNSLFSSHIMRIRTKSTVYPEYIWALLNSHYGKRQISMVSIDSKSFMLNISINDLESIPIVIPPKSLQNKFTQTLAIYRNHQQKLNYFTKKINNLISSILSKAFSGELTKSWHESNKSLLIDEEIEREKILNTASITNKTEYTYTKISEYKEIIQDINNSINQLIKPNPFSEILTNILSISENINTTPYKNYLDKLRSFIDNFTEISKLSINLPVQISEALNLLNSQPSPLLVQEINTFSLRIQHFVMVTQIFKVRQSLQSMLTNDLLDLINKITIGSAYFLPETLVDNDISLIEVEEKLRLLSALGIIRPVVLHGQACYRIVSYLSERDTSEGLNV